MKQPLFRARYDLDGIVQGVGFRPAMYRLAAQWHLGGSVSNRAGTVRLVLEGTNTAINGFLAALPSSLPANARMDTLRPIDRTPIDASEQHHSFVIGTSRSGDRVHVVIPPDLRICGDCLREIMDPADRRYGYPFTTCTHCGPRYTVVERMPYDRERTAMVDFPMCEACRCEYENPSDHRFHAETIACAACGPRLALSGPDGQRLDEEPLQGARAALRRGEVVAVRGIGGFLLAVDARNREALARLRRTKHRPDKPFAVMAPDLDTLRTYAEVPAEAAALLDSPAAPIVILDVLPEAVSSGRLPLELISPDTLTLGAMLPTSPLHVLLFESLHDDPLPRFPLLVMTSGNRRGEPICLSNEEAFQRLHGIADTFLVHDRRIELRNDDSVCVLRDGRTQVWRRARGYAPAAIRLHRALDRCVLAMGAELKNAIALGDDRRIILSPHIGDLETLEALDGMQTVVNRLPEFLERQPQCIAVDLHPDMHATRTGLACARRMELPLVSVQHHHAHGAACMAEHGLEHAVALCFDGTGLGTDGSIWGAELLEIALSADARSDHFRPQTTPQAGVSGAVFADGFVRHATFDPVPLPGGDAAVRRPVRQLIARWQDAGAVYDDDTIAQLGLTSTQADTWSRQAARRFNAPLVHSAGRLFDAFSALLGLCPDAVTYEGQAAIRLEAAARQAAGAQDAVLTFAVRKENGMLHIDWRGLFEHPRDLARLRADATRWAWAFHDAVARAGMAMIQYGVSEAGTDAVVLSGGVFMNKLLTDLLVAACRSKGYRVFLHRESPPNDGCIALGQAAIAGYGLVHRR